MSSNVQKQQIFTKSLDLHKLKPAASASSALVFSSGALSANPIQSSSPALTTKKSQNYLTIPVSAKENSSIKTKKTEPLINPKQKFDKNTLTATSSTSTTSSTSSLNLEHMVSDPSLFTIKANPAPQPTKSSDPKIVSKNPTSDDKKSTTKSVLTQNQSTTNVSSAKKLESSKTASFSMTFPVKIRQIVDSDPSQEENSNNAKLQEYTRKCIEDLINPQKKQTTFAKPAASTNNKEENPPLLRRPTTTQVSKQASAVTNPRLTTTPGSKQKETTIKKGNISPKNEKPSKHKVVNSSKKTQKIVETKKDEKKEKKIEKTQNLIENKEIVNFFNQIAKDIGILSEEEVILKEKEIKAIISQRASSISVELIEQIQNASEKLEEIEKKSIIIEEETRKPTKIEENRTKPSKIEEESQKPTRIEEIRTKPTIIVEESQKPTKIEENKPKPAIIVEESQKPTKLDQESQKIPQKVVIPPLFGSPKNENIETEKFPSFSFRKMIDQINDQRAETEHFSSELEKSKSKVNELEKKLKSSNEAVNFYEKKVKEMKDQCNSELKRMFDDILKKENAFYSIIEKSKEIVEISISISQKPNLKMNKELLSLIEKKQEFDNVLQDLENNNVDFEKENSEILENNFFDKRIEKNKKKFIIKKKSDNS